MDTKTISIKKATALAGAIQAVSETGTDKKPIYALPFKFTYALARTLNKLQEALKPIQEKNQEIFAGWEEESAKLKSKIKNAKGEAKDKAEQAFIKAFKARNEPWKKIEAGEIQVEIYKLPDFTDDEKEQIFSAGLTAGLLADLEPMDLQIDLSKAA